MGSSIPNSWGEDKRPVGEQLPMEVLRCLMGHTADRPSTTTGPLMVDRSRLVLVDWSSSDQQAIGCQRCFANMSRSAHKKRAIERGRYSTALWLVRC